MTNIPGEQGPATPEIHSDLTARAAEVYKLPNVSDAFINYLGAARSVATDKGLFGMLNQRGMLMVEMKLRPDNDFTTLLLNEGSTMPSGDTPAISEARRAFVIANPIKVLEYLRSNPENQLIKVVDLGSGAGQILGGLSRADEVSGQTKEDASRNILRGLPGAVGTVKYVGIEFNEAYHQVAVERWGAYEHIIREYCQTIGMSLQDIEEYIAAVSPELINASMFDETNPQIKAQLGSADVVLSMGTQQLFTSFPDMLSTYAGFVKPGGKLGIITYPYSDTVLSNLSTALVRLMLNVGQFLIGKGALEDMISYYQTLFGKIGDSVPFLDFNRENYHPSKEEIDSCCREFQGSGQIGKFHNDYLSNIPGAQVVWTSIQL